MERVSTLNLIRAFSFETRTSCAERPGISLALNDALPAFSGGARFSVHEEVREPNADHEAGRRLGRADRHA